MDFKEFFLVWMLKLTLKFDCLNALLTKQQRELRAYGFLMFCCNFQWFIGFSWTISYLNENSLNYNPVFSIKYWCILFVHLFKSIYL